MGADLIQGKKGSGKSKLAVMQMRDKLKEGRLVATNLDLYLDKLMPPMSRAVAIRVPDKPSIEDLEACGSGNNGDRYNEDHDGLMVLDELATWLNARTYADKGRGKVLDWLVHSRKLGWGTALICQDASQIDKQVRESQVDYVTRCVRLDRVRIPIVGWLIQALFGKKRGVLPKLHIATRRLGADRNGLLAGNDVYRDGGVEKGYDTLQVFREDYPHGVHSLLSAWHLVGRHLPQKVTLWQRVKRFVAYSPRPRAATLKPKLPAVQLAAGLARDEAWHLARRYVQATSSRPSRLSKLAA